MDKQEDTTFRPWGFFTNIAQKDGYLVKIIHVNARQQLSVQSHNFRSEHWLAVKGSAEVLINDKKFILEEGCSIDVPLKAIHSLKNSSEDYIEIIEIQRGEKLSEDDIIRYKDIYGRV